MNHIQGKVELYLAKNTEMNEKDISQKFHKDNIASANFEVVLSNGELHKFSVMEMISMCWLIFENDDEVKELSNCGFDDQIAM